ncbi:MAG: Rieske 2Fe-2S domain-containing protein [Acidimicrobiales bacterium]
MGEAPPVEHTLGPVTQVPVGEGRLFDVDGWPVAVLRPRDGNVYAVDPVCPHKGGPLADGLLGGTVVVCPLHGWTFDLATGCRVGGPEAVASHPVRVEDGQIVLGGRSLPAEAAVPSA